MARVITFSRTFPAHHPKAGEPTYFVEKFWKSLWDQDKAHDIHYFQEPYDELFHPWGKDLLNVHRFTGKHHTIRAGDRWKAGDYFSPRVWGTDVNPKSGKSGPYHSKQITIGPDIEIKKVWDFEIEPVLMKNVNPGDLYVFIKINGQNRWCNASIPDSGLVDRLAINDGLSVENFKAWFKWGKPFKGQIICWNEQIEY